MMRILVVDDHAVVRRGLRDILMEEFPNAEIAEAVDANEAEALLTKKRFNIALLDINLPGGRGGLDLLEDIRRLHTEIPVLVLSVYPESEFAIRSLKLGASGYLNKASEPSELLVAVRRILAGGKYVSGALAQKLAGMLGGELEHSLHEALSNRELEVLRAIATGRPLKGIAGDLGLSEKTVSTYRARLAHKLGLPTNAELVRYALQHRLVD